MANYQDRRAIESAKAFARDLELLGIEVATRIGVRANRKAAVRLMDRLVAVVPENPEGPTKKYKTLKSGETRSYFYGSARENIRVRRVKARKQGHIVMQVTAGNAFWLTFYEFGTVTQPARPFWRRHAESLRDELVTIQLDELRAGIDKQLAKTRKRYGPIMQNGRNG